MSGVRAVVFLTIDNSSWGVEGATWCPSDDPFSMVVRALFLTLCCFVGGTGDGARLSHPSLFRVQLASCGIDWPQC